MKTAWTLALRDLRGGVKGLRLLVLCLLLGVAALAGVGSLSSAIVAALAEQGQAILGGDIEMEVDQREATAEERAAFARLGDLSETVRMRAMASRLDGKEAVLAELKGVDAAYPLYGTLSLEPGAVKSRPQGREIAIAPALADRLRVRTGDTIRIGEAELRVIGIIAEEPDRVGEGFTFGPAALTDMAGIAATQLVQPGSLYSMRYRIKTPPGVDAAARAGELENQYENAGWDVKNASNAAPSTRRFITRLGQFLALVGLTALIVAGIGVGNGVGSYLEARRGSIATLKVLGASSRTIFAAYLIQIGIVAAVGIVIGLALGAAVPGIVGAVAGDALPVRPRLDLYPLPLALAAAYGLLIALLFTLAPLARARAVSAASLFRAGVEGWRMPSAAILGVMIATAGGIAALAILTAQDRWFATLFIGAVIALFALLTLLGVVIRAIAARLPRPRHALARLALANLHRPGAQTGRLVVALGLGLTLFATLAVVETNLSGQMASTVPKTAPSFFALDIPTEDVGRFRALAGRAPVVTVPSLRGSVVAVKGVPVADLKPYPEGAWILRGDRGLTYAATLPEGSELVAGKWWPADYAGPPLVSLDAEAAKVLDLKVGDTITVSVLGVEMVATIASLREIHWDTMGFNFAMIFSPGMLEAAPHSFMAAVELPEAAEAGFSRAVTAAFPSVSLIRVKEVIGQIGDIFAQLSTAVSAAASVAVAAGIAVLIGAIAASRRARLYDAVILKLSGATRAQVLGAQAIEYAVLAAILSALALAIGAGAGWYVVTRIFALQWSPDWAVVIATVVLGALMTLGIGLLGALPALAARPAQALREL